MSNAIELHHLCTVEAQLSRPVVLPDTPSGTRMVFEIKAAKVEGDRLSGTLTGNAGADWLTVAPDGTGTLDVRSLMTTDDGAVVFIQYLGRVDTSVRGAPVYATPRFDTGDERYRWLNKIQAVGKGTHDGSTLTYDWYEVR